MRCSMQSLGLEGRPGIEKLRYAFITTPTLEASALKASATLPEEEFCNYHETQVNGEPSAETDTDQAAIVQILAGANRGICRRKVRCM